MSTCTHLSGGALSHPGSANPTLRRRCQYGGPVLEFTTDLRTRLLSRPDSHAAHVVSYSQTELAREALPKLRDAKRSSHRTISRELAIPLITVWRTDHERDEDGEVPTPRRCVSAGI